MGWNEVERDNKGRENTEFQKIEFIEFPEGATEVRIVDKEPFSRWVHWIPQLRRSYTCPGKGCPICNIIKNAKANGEIPKYNSQKRYCIHAIDRKDGQLKILENSKTFFGSLLTIRKAMLDTFGDLTNYDIKIIRTGKGKQTQWNIIPLGQTPLTDKEEKDIEENRVDFATYLKAPTPEQLTRLLNGETPDEVFKEEPDEEDIEVDFTEY